MAEGGRDHGRMQTVEIQRRPGRQGTMQKRPDGGAGAPLKTLGDPSEIPSAITEAFAPEGFDEASTLLACNFPSGWASIQCRNLFSWLGPVIRVERGPSVTQETNFLVVFASPAYAQMAFHSSVEMEDGKRIYTRMVDIRPTLWRKVTDYFNSVVSGSWR